MAGISRSLSMNLALNSVNFSKGLSKGMKAVQGFGKGIVSTITTVATSFAYFGLAVDGVKQAVNLVGSVFGDQIETIDKLSKSARRFGIDTDQLTGIHHAAALAGVGVEDVTGALGLLSRKMGMAKLNPALVKDWAAFGFDTQKLLAMDPGAAFVEIADGIAAMNSPTDRAAAAFATFGKKGQSVIDLLAEGKGSIASAVKEAERLGLTVGAGGGLLIEELSDNMDRLKASFDGFRRQMLMLLAPAFDEVMRFATNSLVSLRQAAMPVFTWLKDFAVGTWVAISKAWTQFGQPVFDEVVKWLASWGSAFPNAKDAAINTIEGIVQAINLGINQFKIWAGVFLRDFQSPINEGLAELATGLSDFLLQFSTVSEAFGGKTFYESAHALNTLGKTLAKVGKLQQQVGQDLAGTALDANKDVIHGWFDEVRNELAKGVGMKKAWGWLTSGASPKGGGGLLGGGSPGAGAGDKVKEMKMQFSGTMERGSKEAFSAIAAAKYGDSFKKAADLAQAHLNEAKLANQRLDKLVQQGDADDADEGLLDFAF